MSITVPVSHETAARTKRPWQVANLRGLSPLSLRLSCRIRLTDLSESPRKFEELGMLPLTGSARGGDGLTATMPGRPFLTLTPLSVK